MSSLYYESSISHYGVLGMKWGIRRTKEQLGRHTIKKGTKMYRVTVNSNESLTGQKYVTYLKVDRDHYRGKDANDFRLMTGDPKATLYERQLIAKEDIKVASRDDLMASYDKVLSDKSTMRSTVKSLMQFGDIEMDSTVSDLNKLTSKDLEKQIDTFIKKNGSKTVSEITFPTIRSLGALPEVQKKLVEDLSSKGFNAMVDEASVGGEHWGAYLRGGVDPLIVFDGDKSLSDKGSKKVSSLTEGLATARYDQWKDVATKQLMSNLKKGKDEW